MGIIVDIRPTGIESAIVYAPFDKAFEALIQNGYKIISLSQNAELRIQQGEDHNVSKNGNWVKEGILYVPGKGKFITRHSPVLTHPTNSTQAHRNGREYFVSDNQIKKALEDSIQIPYDVNEISTEGFGEDEITMFCFGKNAKDYGLFLKDAGISNMSLWLNRESYIQKQEKPYANQLWLGGLGDKFVLIGNYGGLHYDILSRGFIRR